jgi:chromosome partitioning protein
MILAVGNVKGRVGKTTLAINLSIALARAKRDVLLIDGDEQGTALAFTDLRTTRKEGPPGYTAVALHGANLRTQVRQLARKYSDIVIDVGGRDTESMRAGLSVLEWNDHKAIDEFSHLARFLFGVSLKDIGVVSNGYH